jgi:hypothetical protein
MANKMGSRISAGLLAAMTLGLLIPASALAQSREPVDARAIPGTTYAGRYGALTQATGGNYWWYGAGAGGGGGGGAAMYGAPGMYSNSMNDNANQLLYPTADGPQPTTAPVPSYQTEAADAQSTAHVVPHMDGPSMSLQPDDIGAPSGASYFRGFWRDMQMGSAFGRGGGGNASTSARMASNVPQGQLSQFGHPQVESRLSPVEFKSGATGNPTVALSPTAYAVGSELRPKLEEAEQMLRDAKVAGQLGTFDAAPLAEKMLDLRRRAREIIRIQNPVEQRTEEGKLINEISQFEYEIQQHAN